MSGHTKPKRVVSHATFPYWISPCQKTEEIDTLLPEIMIKESCNLIGQEHFSLQLTYQVWGLHGKTKNCNVFRFRLKKKKSNVKIS